MRPWPALSPPLGMPPPPGMPPDLLHSTPSVTPPPTTVPQPAPPARPPGPALPPATRADGLPELPLTHSVPAAPQAPGAALASSTPKADQPAAVAPAPPKPRFAPTSPAPPSNRLRPGDLVCGQCGEGNEPIRKFCRRCGTSLEAAVIVGTPWYRRLLPRRRPRVMGAGERPRRGGRSRGLGGILGGAVRSVRRVVPIVVLLAVLAISAIPGLRQGAQDRALRVWHGAADLVIPRYEPVHAISAEASSHITGHDAPLAIDGYQNRFWAVDLSVDPKPRLSLIFDRPTNVDKMIFTTGDTDHPMMYAKPERLHLVFSNNHAQDITLADKTEHQEVDINDAHGILRVDIYIISAWPVQSGSTLAIGEVEMSAKQ